MSTEGKRLLIRYYRPGDEAAGRRSTYSYMISAQTHPTNGFTVSFTGMNPGPVEGELCAGHMQIRDTTAVEVALLGAKARIDSHHTGFTSSSEFVDRSKDEPA